MERLTTTTSTDAGLELAKWLGGAAAGALLMYMLDPDRGGARRAQSAAAVKYAGSRTTGALGNVWRGAGEKLGSAADGVRSSASDLADSARSSVPSDSGIGSTLSRVGRIASDMLDDTLSKAKSAASRASDVADVALSKASSAVNRASDAAGDMLGKSGSSATDNWNETKKSASRFGARTMDAIDSAKQRTTGAKGEWGSTARNSALVGGGLLALFGLARRSPMSIVVGLAGAALLARGATNQPLRSMIGSRDKAAGSGPALGLGQTIDFVKAIHIDAQPEEVYDLWANYENFPRFMSHVVEVRDLGRRRSHWVVRGPGGTEFAWNSVLTEQTRPQRLAWRSEPGAEIPQTGSIQFERSHGGTLVTVRMSYTPPAGAIGHGLAVLLGSDPKSRMDEDLGRMKTFIERGMIQRDPSQSRGLGRFLH
jgi:uncharacterized membrane protein